MHNAVYILWDASHIWGLMALRAIRAFGLNCRLVKSKEIAQGSILGKPEAILLVPGGNARIKAHLLGSEGIRIVRGWIAKGGCYYGFCGGAGLALSHKKASDGLAICPWQRASYAKRLYHFLSGHVWADCSQMGQLPLPIWWPGRFAVKESADIKILASYICPAADLWLADLPFAKVSEQVQKQWKELYELEPLKDFPEGQPLVIKGKFGKGAYILSYAHLETPQSEHANKWLGRLLGTAASLIVPDWTTTLDEKNSPMHDIFHKDAQVAIKNALVRVSALFREGEELGLFFRRTSWLWGWRQGTGGMACNNLLASLACLNEMNWSSQSLALWQKGGKNFCKHLTTFIEEAHTYLCCLRLGATVRINWNIKQDLSPLKQQGQKLFGHPMAGKGDIEILLNFLEELVYLNACALQNSQVKAQ